MAQGDQIIKDQLMREMRTEFMPRETLNITFSHINDKLVTIDGTLKALPRDLAAEFEARFGERISTLEREMEEFKALKWKIGGIFVVLQGAFVFFFEHFFKP